MRRFVVALLLPAALLSVPAPVIAAPVVTASAAPRTGPVAAAATPPRVEPRHSESAAKVRLGAVRRACPDPTTPCRLPMRRRPAQPAVRTTGAFPQADGLAPIVDAPTIFSAAPLVPDSRADFGLVMAPDGTMWEAVQDGVGTVAATGAMTVYTAQNISGVSNNVGSGAGGLEIPHPLIVGPDDNIWFTWCLLDDSANARAGGIGRVTAAGVVTEFEIDQLLGCPRAFVTGLDDRIWLVDASGSQLVYAATVTGGPFAVTSYPLDQANCGCTAFLGGITAGTSGAVTVSGGVSTGSCSGCLGIVVVAADGQGTPYPISSAIAPLSTVLETIGSNVWMVNSGGAVDATKTEAVKFTGGSSTTYTTDGWAGSAAVGPDGNLWMVVATSNLLTLPATTELMSVTSAGTFTPHALSKECQPTFAEYSNLAAGPGSTLWVAGDNLCSFGIAGGTSSLVLPVAAGDPYALGAGPDGSVWSVTLAADWCGDPRTQPCHEGWVTEVLPTGVVHLWPFARGALTPPDYFGVPNAMVEGPDGNMWFTLPLDGEVVRVTDVGNITMFDIPSGDGAPLGIAAGSDGALWFSTGFLSGGTLHFGGNDVVGRLTTGGSLSTVNVPGVLRGGIASGPGGDLWAPGKDDSGQVAMFRITTSGVVTTYAEAGVHAGSGIPEQVVTTPSVVWMTNFADDKTSIDAISPGGSILRYDVGTAQPLGMALGADGALWFTDTTDAFGRLTPAGALLRVPEGLLPLTFSTAMVTADDTGDVWFGNSQLVRLNLTTLGPSTAETVGGGAPVEKPTTCSAGWPVNCATGEFWHTFGDVAVPGRGLPLDFARTYSTGLADTDGPLGYGWTHSYAMHLDVDSGTGDATVEEQNGARVVFAPDGIGGYVAPGRVLATLTADNGGGYTFTPVNGDRYRFDSAGRLTEEIDRDGYVTALAYDGGGLLQSVTDPAGRTLTFTYDGANRMSSMTDPAGQSITMGYDVVGNLVTLTDQSGGTWSFDYDGSHRMLTMTNPDGHATTNTYDGSGRVATQTDPAGRATTFGYATGKTTVTSPSGTKTVDTWFDNQLLTSTRAAGTSSARTTSYGYDIFTNGLVSVTDPAGHTSTSSYDLAGDVTSTTDAAGHTMTSTYNLFGEPLLVTDAAGATTSYSYDAAGDLQSIGRASPAHPSAVTNSYAYEDGSHPGDITATTDPLGRTTHYTYDSDGNATSITDPLGHVTSATFDQLGRALAVTTPRGNEPGATAAEFTTHFSYDPFGDIHTLTDPLGATATRLYNADRFLRQATNAAGHTSHYVYDADDELVRYERADGSVRKQTWTADGLLASRTDGIGHTITFAYDKLGERVRMTDAAGRPTHYSYNSAGQLATVTDPAQRITTFKHSIDGRTTSVSYSGSKSLHVSFTYDAAGRRTGMTDATGTTHYSYTALGELAKVAWSKGGTVTYGYDAAGQLTTMHYPGGDAVTRSYDAAGRLTSVRDWLHHTAHFGYDADGNLTRTTYPNGAKTSATVDQTGATTALTASLGGTKELAWSLQRNGIHQITTLHTAGKQVTASTGALHYTKLGQLHSDRSGGYSYDAGDRLTTAPGLALHYNATGGISSIKRPGHTKVVYHYNTVGGRTAAGTTTMAYDQAGRLTRLRQGKAIDTFGYDGDGLRLTVTFAGAKETDLWDVAQGVPLLLAAGSTKYVYGPRGLAFEQVHKGVVTYLQQDQHGSTRLLTTASGKVAGVRSYTSYGAVARHTGATSRLGFNGGLTDPTGLVYLLARYYDPKTAAFLTVDPMVNDTWQPYSYADDDPVNASDPTGDCTVTIPPAAFTILRTVVGVGCSVMDGGLLAPVCAGNDALTIVQDFTSADPVTAIIDIGGRGAKYTGTQFSGGNSRNPSQATQEVSAPSGPAPTSLEQGTPALGAYGAPLPVGNAPASPVSQAPWSGAGQINSALHSIGKQLVGGATPATGNAPSSPDPVSAAINDFQTGGFFCRPAGTIATLQISCSY